jgi:hypothetical protein
MSVQLPSLRSQSGPVIWRVSDSSSLSALRIRGADGSASEAV